MRKAQSILGGAWGGITRHVLIRLVLAHAVLYLHPACFTEERNALNWPGCQGDRHTQSGCCRASDMQ